MGTARLIDECIKAAGPAWKRYENHPWFAALESGSLPIDQFIRFQVEDAPFIPHLHRALAFGLAKAPIGSSWSRTASAILDEIFVADEIEAKREIVQSLGVDCLFDRWSLSPRREAYVNHIMRTALEGTIGEIAAVLLPCTYFTTLVGRRFEGVDIQGPEAYRRWAAIYAAKQMYSMLSAHIEMIEMEANQNPFSRGELIRIFVRSVQHQVAVFDDALEPGAPWPEVGLEGFGSALA